MEIHKIFQSNGPFFLSNICKSRYYNFDPDEWSYKNPCKKSVHQPLRVTGATRCPCVHMRENVKTRFCNPKRYGPICDARCIFDTRRINQHQHQPQRRKILNGRLALALFVHTCAHDKNALTTRKNSNVA